MIKMERLNFVVVGNLAYDYNYFPGRDGESKKEVINIGGATLYSGIPASIFTKVGIVAKVGEDYDLNIFNDYNFDLKGLKMVEGKTTVFTQIFTSEDGQERIFNEYVNPNTICLTSDIPSDYLNAKYIHVCTNYPKTQLELIKYLKNNSSAVVSTDTLEDYYYNDNDYKYIKKSFDLVDIAYIDKEFVKLFNCNAPIKIIKKGKEGCRYISNDKVFDSNAPICNFVVDKTGAGDCVTGVFGALKGLGYSDEKALQVAVNVATESIKDYGMFHLYEKRDNIKKLIKR